MIPVLHKSAERCSKAFLFSCSLLEGFSCSVFSFTEHQRCCIGFRSVDTLGQVILFIFKTCVIFFQYVWEHWHVIQILSCWVSQTGSLFLFNYLGLQTYIHRLIYNNYPSYTFAAVNVAVCELCFSPWMTSVAVNFTQCSSCWSHWNTNFYRFKPWPFCLVEVCIKCWINFK